MNDIKALRFQHLSQSKKEVPVIDQFFPRKAGSNLFYPGQLLQANQRTGRDFGIFPFRIGQHGDLVPGSDQGFHQHLYGNRCSPVLIEGVRGQNQDLHDGTIFIPTYISSTIFNSRLRCSSLQFNSSAITSETVSRTDCIGLPQLPISLLLITMSER